MGIGRRPGDSRNDRRRRNRGADRIVTVADDTQSRPVRTRGGSLPPTDGDPATRSTMEAAAGGGACHGLWCIGLFVYSTTIYHTTFW